jgi:hypothetical protein
MLNGERATPFEAHAVGAESLVDQGPFGQADWDAVLREAYRRCELEVMGIALVQGDDRIEVPVFDAEAIQRQRIMGFI